MTTAAQRPPDKMKFADFIVWAEKQDGKWELYDGIPVRKHDPDSVAQAERIEHVETKLEVVIALRNAVKKAALNCYALADGVSVEITENFSFIPDALVYCGNKADGKSLTIDNPVIIVEVLSPSTAWKDISEKLDGYFLIKSVAHYLVLDPVRKSMMHHFRDGETIISQAVVTDNLDLSPPGITLDVKSVFS